MAEPERRSADREGSWHMAVGLTLFGLVLGVVTGMSEHEGISDTLLSSLFSFVGGVVLTYTGFGYVKPGQAAESGSSEEAPELRVDPVRVGLSLSGFSIGVLAGVLLGAQMRSNAEDKAAVPHVSAEADESDAKVVKVHASIDLVGLGAPQDALADGKPALRPDGASGAAATPVHRAILPALSLNNLTSTQCEAITGHLQSDVYDAEGGMDMLRKDLTTVIGSSCDDGRNDVCPEVAAVDDRPTLKTLLRVLLSIRCPAPSG